MSIYENLCYRPKHDFGEFEKKEEVSDNWLCIRKMLGERLGEMQYTPQRCHLSRVVWSNQAFCWGQFFSGSGIGYEDY